MDRAERQLVLEQLDSSEGQILELVQGLTPEQWNFRESPERWSIAEILEHLVVFEKFINEVIAKVMAALAEPEKKAFAQQKEPLVLGLADSRSARLKAREVVLPTGRWPDTAEMIAELRSRRAQTVAFAAETEADLRNHFFPHIAFGDLDCYQWLLVIARHMSRHALQIEEIKANPAYPGSR
jgi:hypothetical protein